PGMSGVELAQRLKADPRCASIPMLVLSSIDDFGDQEAASSVFCARLLKPVRQSDLLNAVRRALAPSKSEWSFDHVVQPSRPQLARKAPLKAVLAEDNKVNQIVAADMLAEMGVECVVAGNGKLALEAIHRGGIDLVLMDCQMPEMDG